MSNLPPCPRENCTATFDHWHDCGGVVQPCFLPAPCSDHDDPSSEIRCWAPRAQTPDLLRPNEREILYAPDRRMNAYYYSFDPTGQPAIDAILSAVAHAGKGYHHTESWSDDEWSPWGEGRSAVDVIQAAANEAAAALLAAAGERDALAAKVERVRALHFGEYVEDEDRNRCFECGDDWPCPTTSSAELDAARADA